MQTELCTFLKQYEPSLSHGEVTISLYDVSTIISLLSLLRTNTDFPFQMLIDICGAHYPQQEREFCVIYHLLSVTKNLRIRIKLFVTSKESVPSASGEFSAACWFEREAYDMFGIKFVNTPDMRRILTDYDFQHHPLRKDFPVFGFEEIRYDAAASDIVYEEINLEQKHRDLAQQSEWNMPTYIEKNV